MNDGGHWNNYILRCMLLKVEAKGSYGKIDRYHGPWTYKKLNGETTLTFEQFELLGKIKEQELIISEIQDEYTNATKELRVLLSQIDVIFTQKK